MMSGKRELEAMQEWARVGLALYTGPIKAIQRIGCMSRCIHWQHSGRKYDYSTGNLRLV